MGSNTITTAVRQAVRTGTILLAALAMFVASVVVAPPVAQAAPQFWAPWSCGVTWHASTYDGHAGNGVDFNELSDGSDAGAPVLASADGTATIRFGGGYGHYVDIDHGAGWMTRYAHLASAPTLTDRDPRRTGIQVNRGDVIGRVGASQTSAPHLHYEQRKDNVGQHVRFHGNRIAVGTTYRAASDPTYTSRNCTWYSTGHVLGNFDGHGGDDVLLRRGRRWYLDLGVRGSTSRSYDYARATDQVFVGNFDGHGGDDVLLRRGRTWILDLGARGRTSRSYEWGRASDEVYIGNFDGHGGDDVLLRRGSTWYLDLGARGRTSRSHSWGRATDQVYIGDFNGDGRDDVLLRRGRTWYLDLGAQGRTSRSYQWGRATDQVYIGDFDGDGRDDVLLRRGRRWYVDHGARGTTNRSFDYGRATDQVYIGNIDNRGGDDIVLRRGRRWFVNHGANANTSRSHDYGRATDQVITTR